MGLLDGLQGRNHFRNGADHGMAHDVPVDPFELAAGGAG